MVFGQTSSTSGVVRALPEVGLVGTGVRFVEENSGKTVMIGSQRRHGFLLERLLYDDSIATSSILVRREVLRSLGSYFRIDLSTGGAEDWELKIRLSARCPFHITPEVLVNYYLSDDGLSRRWPIDAYRQNISLIYAMLLEDPVTKAVVRQHWPKLQANIHYFVGREYYRFGQNREARQELLAGLRQAFFTPNLRSSLILLFVHPRFRQAYRKFKMRCRRSTVTQNADHGRTEGPISS